MPILLCCALVVTCATAHAGFVEIGASGSMRKSTIDQNSYDQTQAITASVTYYFDESSAVELSYTNGASKRAFAENLPFGQVTSLFYSLIGLDMIYTFGPKENAFRPYLKGGANYILEKRIVQQARDSNGIWESANVIPSTPALVPSLGAGVRIGLTQNLSLKVGIDAWTSGPVSQRPLTLDYAGRIGLALMF